MKSIGTIIFLLFTTSMYGQSVYLQRSAVGMAGFSGKTTSSQQRLYIQQSIGQKGVIGTAMLGKKAIFQGFLQPFSPRATSLSAGTPNSSLIVYPNPFEGTLTVETTFDTSSAAVIKVYNILGNIIYTHNYAHNGPLDLELNHLPAGQYILHLHSNSSLFIHKIQKK
ncbi:T9SS type A sorting domain-containing protein [Flammeovirgaceae bacterium SG7u.111]|nr:T9SS type A sorting domain-containing protein [Flammeovirgaceae bacterium SG7u.132]WPO33686.1 T9SS type A sorting domain-containing protein [Flammeovirgaceae bacterium SG7u.111]